MKKIFMIFAILFIAVTVNAQLFLGGEFGLQVKNDRTKTAGVSKLTNNIDSGRFMVAPTFGYYINDKLAVGLRTGVGVEFVVNKTNKTKDRANRVIWDIFPYVKYHVFTHKKFSIVLEGGLGFGGVHELAKHGKDKVVKGPSIFLVHVFNVAPVLEFKLADHWHLYTALHFLDLGYDIAITKPNPKVKTTQTRHDFRMIFDADDAWVLTNLTIGVYYKF